MSNLSPTFLPTSLLAALSMSLSVTPMAGAQTIAEINDESLFVGQSGATAQPAISTQVGGVVGDLTFSTPAGSTLSFSEQTALIPGTPDLAISGDENLNIDLAAPVFALGFQFADPAGSPNSTFDITLFTGGAGGSVVNSFNFESPKDVLHFGGIVSDTAFDYVEVREIGGNSANEVFGQFYTGASAGKFWTLPSSGTWNVGGSWSGGTAPIATDNVFITDNVTKTITGPFVATTINSLTIDNQDPTNTGSVGSTNLTVSTGPLTVTQDVVVGSIGTDSGTSALNVGVGTLNVGGDTYIREGGTLNVGSGTYNPTGAVNLEGGTLSVSSIGSLVPNWTSGTLEVTGAGGLSVFLNGALGGNPISIDASKTLNVTNTLQINSAVIFDVDGGVVNAGDFTAFLGTVNANSGEVNVAGTYLNQGTTNLAGADVTVNTFDASAVAPNFTGGKLTIDAGSFIPFAGLPDFTLDGATGGPTLELINGGSANFVGDISVAPTNDGGLSVLSGSDLSTTTNLLIGQTKGDSDSVSTFSGLGTTVDVGGNFLMGTGSTTGDQARNQLTVEDGAVLTVDGDTTLGSNARVDLTDGTINTSSWTRLGFSQFFHTGGTLNVDTGNFNSGTSNYVLGAADRPVVNLTNGASYTGGGSTNVDINNGEMHVLSGSTMNLTAATASLQVFNNTGAGAPALLEIDGAGSSVTVNGFVDIGRNTAGHGTLNITNGGSLTTTGAGGSVAIGVNDSTIGIATVDGTGSSMTVGGTAGLFVGNEGVGTLDITDGGLVTTTILTIADSDTNNANTGTSILTVNGTDGVTPSTLNATGLSYIGGSTNEDRGTGILNIQAGAIFTSNGGFIGSGDGTGPDGDGTVNVTGSDSFWNAIANGSSDLYVGDVGAGTLNVTSGGRVDADAVFIGDNAGTETAAMTIDGAGSVVNVRGSFVVGNARLGTLSMTNGAALNTSTTAAGGEFLIGNSTAADNSSALIDNSTVVHSGTGRVAVGDNSNGTPSSMTLQNGGTFTAATSTLFVADITGSTGNLVVDGEGSLLSVGPRIAMGDNGVGTMTVSNGGDVEVTDPGSMFEVGAASGGSVGTLTVTDPGSTVTVGNWLSVGDESTANGTLDIENGGSVSSGGHSYIARVNSTSTGTITVQDLDTNDGSSGSSLNVGDSLFLGGNASGGGGDATLNVNDGGTVNVTDELKLWDDGKVNLNGGTINVGTFDLFDPPEAPTPNFTFNSGTFRYTAGATLSSETLNDLLGPGVPTLSSGKNLVVTDQAAISAALRLNGGSLSVGSVFNNDLSNLDFDAGTLNLTDSSLVVTAAGLLGGDLTVEPDQTINITNNTFVQSDGTLTVVGNFNAGGTISNSGDLVIVDATGTGKTVNGAVNNSGDLTVVGDITFADNLTGAGGIFGPGNAIIGAGFAPGNSPGTVTVENDLTLTDTSTLSIELGGVTPGTEFDRVEVGGLAMIDGTLDVTLIDGFTPSAGNSFGFLFANGGFGGNFDSLNLPDISGQGLAWSLNPGGSTLFLEVDALLQGDLNGDGFVGIDDLNIVLGNWNQNVPPANPLADPSGDGFVGIDDLNAVLGNWNAGTPPTVGQTTIPEPATGVLMMIAGGMWVGRKPRQCNKNI